MSKLIELPGGKYIKADAIVSVGELWKDDYLKEWRYSIGYLDNGDVTYHNVMLESEVNVVETNDSLLNM